MRNGTISFGLALVTLAAGCGGGGAGSGSVSALTIPSQMTVVAAQDTQTGGARIVPERSRGQQPRRSVPRGALGAVVTDYQSDATRLWVHDESLQPLEMINQILCMLGQTGYSDPDVLNGPEYIALVNEVACGDKGGDPTSGGGNQGGGTSVSYKEWRVKSERASDSAPQVVKFWIDWDEEVGQGQRVPGRLYGKLTITESPSDAAPYGKFTLNFKMVLRSEPDTSTNCIFFGTLSTVTRNDGLAEYTLYNAQGDINVDPAPGGRTELTRARVVTTAAGTSGQAYSARISKRNEGGVQTDDTAYHIAYNANYMARRKVSGSEVIEAYDRNSFVTFPFSYGLYDSTSEARVTRNSGFGVKTAGGVHGYAGFHGIWFPGDVTVSNGLQVIRESRSGGASETYTVFTAPGKLEKRTRVASTLGNLKDENLYTWDQVLGSVTVQWTGSDLVRTSYFDQQNSQWVVVDPPISVLSSYSANQWVGFNSPARGEINMIWPASTPTDATPVAIWGIEVINADSADLAGGNLALTGYFQMLRSAITQNQANWQNGETPYFPDATNVGQGRDYVFDKTTLTLTLQGVDVTLANGVTIDGGPSMGGLSSGPMVTSPLAALSDMSSQTVTWRWQTGTQNWNKLQALKNASNAFVQFDPPLVFNYTHNEPGNARFHNKAFRLEYEGVGELHGVPFEEDQGTHRWYPVFAIPTGTLLTNSTGTYKVKVLEAEQRMNAVSNPQQLIQQQGLDLNNTLTPPTNTWSDPAIGPRPDVDTPPLYIDGKKQTS